MPNTGLSIFNNKITLNKGNIFGKYSGDRLKITGAGKINGFDSEIEFTQNFEDQTEFHHKLNIITALQFSKSSKKLQKIGFIKFYRNGSLHDTVTGSTIGNIDSGGSRDNMRFMKRDNNSNTPPDPAG